MAPSVVPRSVAGARTRAGVGGAVARPVAGRETPSPAGMGMGMGMDGNGGMATGSAGGGAWMGAEPRSLSPHQQ